MRMKISIKVDNWEVMDKTFEWDDDLIKLFLQQIDTDLTIYEKSQKWRKENIKFSKVPP